jgi:hypothetical protein
MQMVSIDLFLLSRDRLKRRTAAGRTVAVDGRKYIVRREHRFYNIDEDRKRSMLNCIMLPVEDARLCVSKEWKPALIFEPGSVADSLFRGKFTREGVGQCGVFAPQQVDTEAVIFRQESGERSRPVEADKHDDRSIDKDVAAVAVMP